MRRNLITAIALLFSVSLLGTMPAGVRARDDESSAKGKSSDTNSKDQKDRDGDKSDAEKGDKDGKKKAETSPIKKLIELKLDYHLIPARALNIPLPGKTRTLRDLSDRFKKWSEDDEIGAVLLDLDGVNLSIPDVEELRAAVKRLRDGGKKVFSFVNIGEPMSYLVACDTDEICIAPTGSVGIPGLGRAFPFMRGYYQMIGLEFEVITAGKFKYPGFLNKREPDKYFKEEFGAILDGWFGDYVKFIAEGRDIPEADVKEAIDIALFDAQEAKNRGLVDVLAYYDDYADRLVRRYKFKKAKEGESDFANITSLQDLLSAWAKEVKKAQDKYKEVGPKIAILNARGPIVDVNLGPSLASSLIMRDQFVKTIEEIRKNKTIKAVVMRVDSPGGSGYASDVIWQKLRELDEEKPLVVSMGSVAGSGGYYIACPARLIFAEPTTITGSIGVLGILPCFASQYNRMDVNLAEMIRGERSLLGYGIRDLKPEDRDFIQQYILDFYEVFLDRVASTRKIPKEELRKIAGGRIYTGRQGLDNGLVDRLGGLDDAIAAVRDMANIPASAEIKLVDYPRPATFGELIESFGAMGVSASLESLQRAGSMAPYVTFDSQVRFFGRRFQPLCWMGVPETDLVFGPIGAMVPSIDLMDLTGVTRPSGAALPPLVPQPGR